MADTSMYMRPGQGLPPGSITEGPRMERVLAAVQSGREIGQEIAGKRDKDKEKEANAKWINARPDAEFASAKFQSWISDGYKSPVNRELIDHVLDTGKLFMQVKYDQEKNTQSLAQETLKTRTEELGLAARWATGLRSTMRDAQDNGQDPQMAGQEFIAENAEALLKQTGEQGKVFLKEFLNRMTTEDNTMLDPGKIDQIQNLLFFADVYNESVTAGVAADVDAQSASVAAQEASSLHGQQDQAQMDRTQAVQGGQNDRLEATQEHDSTQRAMDRAHQIRLKRMDQQGAQDLEALKTRNLKSMAILKQKFGGGSGGGTAAASVQRFNKVEQFLIEHPWLDLDATWATLFPEQGYETVSIISKTPLGEDKREEVKFSSGNPVNEVYLQAVAKAIRGDNTPPAWYIEQSGGASTASAGPRPTPGSGRSDYCQ